MLKLYSRYGLCCLSRLMLVVAGTTSSPLPLHTLPSGASKGWQCFGRVSGRCSSSRVSQWVWRTCCLNLRLCPSKLLRRWKSETFLHIKKSLNFARVLVSRKGLLIKKNHKFQSLFNSCKKYIGWEQDFLKSLNTIFLKHRKCFKRFPAAS